MIDKILSAIFLPALMMILLTRITYSRTVGFFLTLALIIVSAYKGYIFGWGLIMIEAASLTIGLYIANFLSAKSKTNEGLSKRS